MFLLVIKRKTKKLLHKVSQTCLPASRGGTEGQGESKFKYLKGFECRLPLGNKRVREGRSCDTEIEQHQGAPRSNLENRYLGEIVLQGLMECEG